MTEDEYGKHLDALIATLAGGTYMDPDTMAEKMVVGHKANAKVFVALRNMPKCGVTAAKLETALKRKARNDSAAEAAAERDARMQTILGCRPDTERAMVAAFLAQGNYEANFGGQFTRDGEVVPKNDLLIDIQLTAADLRLNHKPLELKDRNYERALIEFLSRRRAERLAEIIAMITDPHRGGAERQHHGRAVRQAVQGTRLCDVVGEDGDLADQAQDAPHGDQGAPVHRAVRQRKAASPRSGGCCSC